MSDYMRRLIDVCNKTCREQQTLNETTSMIAEMPGIGGDYDAAEAAQDAEADQIHAALAQETVSTDELVIEPSEFTPDINDTNQDIDQVRSELYKRFEQLTTDRYVLKSDFDKLNALMDTIYEIADELDSRGSLTTSKYVETFDKMYDKLAQVSFDYEDFAENYWPDIRAQYADSADYHAELGHMRSYPEKR